ncbi:hypothetical protein BDY24DRAFT_13247 [Mrakia frigida]|uniref:uncharacterized protein n=1 Tax=Mrakia frigida TaxID=29902 RepID=UPI003FCC1AF3
MVAIQHDPSLLPPSLKIGLEGKEPFEYIAIPDGTLRPVKIQEFRTVGSFSYLDGKEPCVLVPSAPPEIHLRLPVKIRPDSGDTLLDVHSLKLPGTSPLSSSLQVAHLLTPTLDFSSLSFITDENTLLNLFGMIRGEQKAFRIDGDLSDDAVLLHSCEKEIWDRSHAFKGYEESFKRRETVEVKGCEGTVGGYWRLSTFELGHHKILLRYQVDAQLPLPPPSQFNTPPRRSSDGDASCDSPSSSSSSIAFASLPPSSSTPTPFSLTTTSTPTLSYLSSPSTTLPPPQSSLLSLSSSPLSQPFSPSSHWPHLYLTQTSTLYLGAHDKFGTFSSANFKKLQLGKGELKAWGEREGFKTLGKVNKVLERMRRCVKKEGKLGGGGRVSFVFEGTGSGSVVMSVWRRTKGREEPSRV